jgi:hypothetical protein
MYFQYFFSKYDFILTNIQPYCVGALFTENMVERKEIRMHAKILSALAASAIQQRHLIAAFEWLCGTKYPTKYVVCL